MDKKWYQFLTEIDFGTSTLVIIYGTQSWIVAEWKLQNLTTDREFKWLIAKSVTTSKNTRFGIRKYLRSDTGLSIIWPRITKKLAEPLFLNKTRVPFAGINDNQSESTILIRF